MKHTKTPVLTLVQPNKPASRDEVMEALRTAIEWATIGSYDDVYITMKKGKSSVTISADPCE